MDDAFAQIRSKSKSLKSEGAQLREHVNGLDKELGELHDEWQRVKSQKDDYVKRLKAIESEEKVFRLPRAYQAPNTAMDLLLTLKHRKLCRRSEPCSRQHLQSRPRERALIRPSPRNSPCLIPDTPTAVHPAP